MSNAEGKPFEYRLQRLLFYEGFFARTSIHLHRYFYPQKVQITELDVVGVAFMEFFRPRMVLVDCKSGKAKEADRILRLKGLLSYFSADAAIFAKTGLEESVRKFAGLLEIDALDDGLISARERELGIESTKPVGSHNLALREGLLKNAKHALRGNKLFHRYYWFLNSDFWYLDNFIRLKKLGTGFRAIQEHWVPGLNKEKELAMKWFFYESTLLFTLCMLYLCHEATRFSPDKFRTYVGTKLASGIADYGELKRLAETIDDYVKTVLRESVGQQPLDFQLPALFPKPPEYTNELLDMVDRFVRQGNTVRDLLRFQDMLFYEFLLQGRQVEREVFKTASIGNLQKLAKQTQNVVKMICRQFAIPEEQVGASLLGAELLARLAPDEALTGTDG